MDSGLIANKNTEWTKYPGVLWCYVLMVFMAKWFLGFWFTPDVAWTLLNCVHGVVRTALTLCDQTVLSAV
jgi:hypothetical protein